MPPDRAARRPRRPLANALERTVRAARAAPDAMAASPPPRTGAGLISINVAAVAAWRSGAARSGDPGDGRRAGAAGLSLAHPAEK